MNKMVEITRIKCILSVLCFFALFSCSNEKIPGDLAGTYFGSNRIIARYEKDGQLLDYEDNVNVTIEISDYQQVGGKVGDAVFEDCKIEKNRGWIGRQFGIKTDFLINGSLKGFTFPKDTLINKEISIPFNVENGELKGSVFMKRNGESFPVISNLKLQKR